MCLRLYMTRVPLDNTTYTHTHTRTYSRKGTEGVKTWTFGMGNIPTVGINVSHSLSLDAFLAAEWLSTRLLSLKFITVLIEILPFCYTFVWLHLASIVVVAGDGHLYRLVLHISVR